MRIIGIDPGLGTTGYGVIESKGSHIKLIEAGRIRTSHSQAIYRRLTKIYSELEKLLKEFKPDLLALEDLYSHYKHPKTSILMAHARGIVYLASCQQKIEIRDYSAKRIKKAITGTGNATKGQVEKMVASTLNLNRPINQADVADALAIAIGCLYMDKCYDKSNSR